MSETRFNKWKLLLHGTYRVLPQIADLVTLKDIGIAQAVDDHNRTVDKLDQLTETVDCLETWIVRVGETTISEKETLTVKDACARIEKWKFENQKLTKQLAVIHRANLLEETIWKGKWDAEDLSHSDDDILALVYAAIHKEGKLGAHDEQSVTEEKNNE